MSDITGLHLLSTLAPDGRLTVSLAEQTLPAPTGSQIVLRVEAAPINPSDLGLLLGSADVDHAEYGDGYLVAQMPEAAMRAMASRLGEAMPVGNEGAGTVIAAGEAAEAQALLGKRGHVDIGIERDRRIDMACEGLDQVDPAPARLGRDEQPAVACPRPDAHRPERAHAQPGERPLFR